MGGMIAVVVPELLMGPLLFVFRAGEQREGARQENKIALPGD
jgi:hypothetical protein